MKKNLLFLLIIFVTTIASSCKWGGTNTNSTNSTNPDKVTQVSLRQEWFPYSGYAGEVYAVNETASKHNLSIRCSDKV
jgi:hypothetical protein